MSELQNETRGVMYLKYTLKEVFDFSRIITVIEELSKNKIHLN